MIVDQLQTDDEIRAILESRADVIGYLAKRGDRFTPGSESGHWWWLLFGTFVETVGVEEAADLADEITDRWPKPPKTEAEEAEIIAALGLADEPA